MLVENLPEHVQIIEFGKYLDNRTPGDLTFRQERAGYGAFMPDYPNRSKLSGFVYQDVAQARYSNVGYHTSTTEALKGFVDKLIAYDPDTTHLPLLEDLLHRVRRQETHAHKTNLELAQEVIDRFNIKVAREKGPSDQEIWEQVLQAGGLGEIKDETGNGVVVTDQGINPVADASVEEQVLDEPGDIVYGPPSTIDTYIIGEKEYLIPLGGSMEFEKFNRILSRMEIDEGWGGGSSPWRTDVHAPYHRITEPITPGRPAVEGTERKRGWPKGKSRKKPADNPNP